MTFRSFRIPLCRGGLLTLLLVSPAVANSAYGDSCVDGSTVASYSEVFACRAALGSAPYQTCGCRCCDIGGGRQELRCTGSCGGGQVGGGNGPMYYLDTTGTTATSGSDLNALVMDDTFGPGYYTNLGECLAAAETSEQDITAHLPASAVVNCSCTMRGPRIGLTIGSVVCHIGPA